MLLSGMLISKRWKAGDRGKCRLERDKGQGILKVTFKIKGRQGLSWQLLAMISCLGGSRMKVQRKRALKSSTKTFEDSKCQGKIK